jgi:hypothetical protein
MSIKEGKEMDTAILEKIMQIAIWVRGEGEMPQGPWAMWLEERQCYFVLEPGHDSVPFGPSTSITDAWKVVDHMLTKRFPNHNMSFGCGYSSVIDWSADFTPRRNHPMAREYEDWSAQGSTAPMAICNAALYALQRIEEQA